MKNILPKITAVFDAIPKIVKGLIALGVLFVIITAAIKCNQIKDCFSDIAACLGQGAAQGEACVIDTDCKGWKLNGTIACCGSKCVTKAQSAQTCSAFLHGSGKACNTPDGTIWPASGCDVSAGICCHQKCSTSCPRAQGESCALDSDCRGWTVTGKTACCGGRCVTKSSSTQTCSAYLKGKGKSCAAADGTIWPLSGCDVSAGICCKGKCSTSCN